MADTIPDITVPNNTFANINTLTGISAGTALILNNKGTSEVLVQISNTQPSATSSDGVVLPVPPNTLSVMRVTAGENAVWARSLGHVSGLINIQDDS